ncbi:hypothetical protein E2C01_021198 [Portunus trituberculatus]|uniref:Uncharacterized protein n=1 Tax=Portunus trituberculatus TaxID=210409 RepID=A0A5B7E5E7_PORTR|nr:hypothetical protein [Portunus trituberculatus]
MAMWDSGTGSDERNSWLHLLSCHVYSSLGTLEQVSFFWLDSTSLDATSTRQHLTDVVPMSMPNTHWLELILPVTTTTTTTTIRQAYIYRTKLADLFK